jgi:hypothetical protein
MKYSALTWVKITIDESLKQTRQALEQFVDYPSDTVPLQQCVAWLHEIHGALEVLELQTATLLVQEIESTIKSLLAGKIESNESTYDVLMRALIQLPNYLDHLAIVQQDMPMALLPLLNDLRTKRKQSALAANNLFTPHLSMTIAHLKAIKLPDDKLKKYALQMRVNYQKGLAAVIKTPKQPQAGLKLIYTVMQRLQQATGTAPVSKIWWVTEGIVEALLQKGLALNNAILSLLKQLLPLINQIAQHGNPALRSAQPKVLTNLLYFVAQARSKGKTITAIKKTFQLNDYFPTEQKIIETRLMFAGPDIELMKIVVTLLKDDFARVEETLDYFNRADNPSVSELSPLVTLLRDMANTLGLLGLIAQRQSMLAQAKVILEMSESRQPAELSNLLEIANALLKISGAVDILAVQGVHAKQRLQQSPDTDFSETPQFGIIMGVVVDEAKTELAQVIQPLVNFIDTGSQDDSLLDVPSRLKQVEGFLAVAAHDRAAKLLGRCNKYIEKVFIKESTVPAEEKLKALADVLIGIELYLDTLAGNPMDAEDILDNAEKRLARLSKKD